MTKAQVRGVTITDATPQYQAQISRVKLTAAATLNKAQISRVKITGALAGKKGQISRVNITGSAAAAQAQIRTVTITGGTLGSLSAAAGGGRFADPLTVVTLDGSASTGPPDSYSWAQVSNGAPTVTLVGSGAVVGFVAPAHINGADLVFELTVTKGPSTDTDLASISVYPQLFWYLNEAEDTWLPEARYSL